MLDGGPSGGAHGDVFELFDVLGIGGAEQGGGGGGVAWGERTDVWALAGALRGGRGGRAVGPAAGQGVEPHLSPRRDKVALNLALSSDRHHRRPSRFSDDPTESGQGDFVNAQLTPPRLDQLVVRL